MGAHCSPPVVDFSFSDPHTLANAHEIFDELRARGPIHWHSGYSAWLVLSHSAVVQAFRDERLGSSRIREILVGHVGLENIERVSELEASLERYLMFMDGPDHARLRSALGPLLSPQFIRDLEVRIVDIADKLLAELKVQGEIDAMTDLAHEFALRVLADVIGISREECAEIRRLGNTNPPLFEGKGLGLPFVLELMESGRVMFRQVADILGSASVRPGSIYERLKQAHGNGILSEDEMVSVALEIVAAGFVPIANLLGQSLMLLVKRPELRRDVLESGDRGKRGVEELLRFVSPNQLTTRVCREEMELAGARFRKGDVVYLMLSAANRDPAVFRDPHTLDPRRDPNPHVGFGGGPHYCIGAALARVEMRVLLPKVFAAFPAIQVRQDGVRWRTGTLRAHGPVSIPCALQ
jgi:cytochrome P450